MSVQSASRLSIPLNIPSFMGSNFADFIEADIAKTLEALGAVKQEEEKERVLKSTPMYGYARRRETTIDDRRALRVYTIFEKRYQASIQSRIMHIGATWKKFAAHAMPSKHPAVAAFNQKLDVIIEQARKTKWEVVYKDEYTFEWPMNQRTKFVDQICNLYRDCILPIKQKMRDEHSKHDK